MMRSIRKAFGFKSQRPQVSSSRSFVKSFTSCVRFGLFCFVVQPCLLCAPSDLASWFSCLADVSFLEYLFDCEICELRHDLDDDHADVTGVEGLPVPRCMLADAIASKTRKKLKSASTNARNQADLAIKKCKDKEEQACLEQAVHGNCKWCEGLCGPNAV